jgi:hypothetical protein
MSSSLSVFHSHLAVTMIDHVAHSKLKFVVHVQLSWLSHHTNIVSSLFSSDSVLVIVQVRQFSHKIHSSSSGKSFSKHPVNKMLNKNNDTIIKFFFI